MSFHEGSNWQARKEDEKKPLYNTQTPSLSKSENIWGKQKFEQYPRLRKVIEWFANNVPVPGTQWNELLHSINESLSQPPAGWKEGEVTKAYIAGAKENYKFSGLPSEFDSYITDNLQSYIGSPTPPPAETVDPGKFVAQKWETIPQLLANALNGWITAHKEFRDGYRNVNGQTTRIGIAELSEACNQADTSLRKVINSLKAGATLALTPSEEVEADWNELISAIAAGELFEKVLPGDVNGITDWKSKNIIKLKQRFKLLKRELPLNS